MNNPSRLQRRVIRQAVEENLEALAGGRRKHRRPWSYRLLVAARIVFFVAFPTALFVSTYVLAKAVDNQSGAEVVASSDGVQLPTNVPALTTEAIAPATMPQQMAMPRPLDPQVLPLALKTVVLDPGHGGDNEGTRSPGGLVEKEVTLDIARRLRDLLEDSGYTVVLTREEDQALSLRARAEIANRSRGDIFVSIHVNWLPNRRLRGLETFYLGPTDDPELEALAARENRQSGYSLADLREILHQVYAGVRQEESRRLAESVQHSLYRAVRQVNETIRDRGVKSAPFGVLTRTDMPAILAEVASVSNNVEARLLMSQVYRQFLAEALFDGILSYSRSLSPVRDLRAER